MNINQIKYIVFCCFCSYCLQGQPVWDTRRVIDSFVVFQDWKNTNIWYYAPGELKLKLKENGQPDFQLTSLRYTGQNLTDNKGEIRFKNIIQLTVQMQNYSMEDLNWLKKKLKIIPGGKLIPIPIKNLETFLMASAGTNEQGNKRLGQPATSNNISGEKGFFWTERSFALALDNYEAQLIDDQIKNNRLALSFSYSYTSELMPGKFADLAITRDSSLINQVGISKDDIETIDTTLTDMVIKGNAFAIYIDLNQFPETVKKVDINENYMPPAFAVVEIRCYDFQDNIRPDLFFKTIELEAVSVNNEPIKTQVKFAQKQPDINTQTVKFEYAVKVNNPLRYRIIETDKSGEKLTSNWVTLQQWKPMIDISNNADNLGIEQRNLDFEISGRKDLTEANIWIRYTFLGKTITDMLYIKSETAENNIFKSHAVRNDKKTPIRYQFIYKTPAGIEKNYWRTITNDYIQLKIN